MSARPILIHHMMWGCICLLLLSVVIGLWFQDHSESRRTATLERQLAAMSRPTCKPRGSWQSDTTSKFDVASVTGIRSYLVHVPSDFHDHDYYPLLLFFGGKSTSAEAAEQSTGLNRLPAVVIYPEPTPGQESVLSWQGAPYASGADDVAFVGSVLDKVEAQLCINRSRVYAAGLSNGGGFVSLLRCKVPERFAAFGVVAGAMYFPAGGCEPTTPSPLINIHGDGDSVVPYSGSIMRGLPAIDSWVATQAMSNSCPPNPSVTYIDTVTVRTSWQGCKNGATVENIRVEGGPHVWAPDAPETLWRFLTQFSL